MNLQKRYLKILDEIQGISDLKQIPEFTSDLNSFIERLTDKEFRIAVVGEFSSGKSTFINALLGKDILNHETTETTAVITRIVNVTKEDKRAYTGFVKLRNGKDIQLKDLTRLKEYTTTLSTEFKVVDEIECVNIYIPIMESKAEIVIVDTPGLNGMADGHRELTVDIIKKAHACIYLLQKRGLTESDTGFIRYLLNYQRNFIFIQNFIDEFRKYEGETIEQKVAEQEKLLKQYVFNDYPEAHFSICGISALLKLASKDKAFKRLYKDSTQDLTDTDRIEIEKRSNFIAFEKILQEQFIDENLTKLQYGDTTWAINHWIHELVEQIQREQRHTMEVLQESKEQGVLSKLEKLKKIIDENKARHEKYLTDFIADQFRGIRKKSNDEIDNKLSLLNSNIDNEINSCRTIEQLMAKSKALPGEFNLHLDIVYDQVKESISARILGLYHSILAQVAEYSGISNTDLKIAEIGLNVQKESGIFKADTSRLDKLKKELDKNKQTSGSIERTITNRNSEIKQARKELNEAETELQNTRVSRQNSISRLGVRPAARTYQETYTYYRDRTGFFGSIVQFFAGKKKCTGYRSVTDDSAGRDWDTRKKAIEDASNERIDHLMKEKGAAERYLYRLHQEQDADNNRLTKANDEVKRLECAVTEEEKTLRKVKESAKNEHLANEKTKLKETVKKYLEEIVPDQIKDSLNKALMEQKDSFVDWTLLKYGEAVQQKLQWVEQCKLEKAPELQNKLNILNKTIVTLTKIMSKMEE